MLEKVPNIPWLKGKVTDFVDRMKIDAPAPAIEPTENLPKKVGEMEKQKQELQTQNAQSLKKAVEDQTQATKESQAKTDGAINALTSVNSQGAGTGSVEQRQIPDEIDNYILAVKANAMDFD